MKYFLVMVAGWIVTAMFGGWLFMLLLGGLHHEVFNLLDAPGYWVSVILFTLVGTLVRLVLLRIKVSISND